MIPELLKEFPQMSAIRLCRLLDVSRAEFYRRAAPGTGSIVPHIERIVTSLLGYGYRRVRRQLVKEGVQVSEHLVRKQMRENGLRCRMPKPKGITKKDPDAQKWENLARKYEPTGLDEIWACDMTLIRTASGPCYLALMLDLYSRKAVAWHLSRNPNLDLALACLNKALEKRRPAPGWIHHSDQGSVYTAPAYVQRVRSAGGRMSMSRPARPTDNAFVESFFATLKKEEVRLNHYDTFLELNASMEEYIDDKYNAIRMHSSLGHLSPDEYEARIREVGQ
jgi:transposase InsO family protein